MIGFIQGTVISSDGSKVVVLTQSGVGYEVNYNYFATVDEQIGIHIFHHITDSGQSLWGFNSLEDKKMFELLKTVNKVGPSKAYPLVSNLGTSALVDVIILDQQAVLTSIKGIGKKMGEQIILSLKDKIKDFGSTTNEVTPNGGSEKIAKVKEKVPKGKIDKSMLSETLLALESLGYDEKNVMPIIHNVYNESIKTSEDLLKQLLKEL